MNGADEKLIRRAYVIFVCVLLIRELRKADDNHTQVYGLVVIDYINTCNAVEQDWSVLTATIIASTIKAILNTILFALPIFYCITTAANDWRSCGWWIEHENKNEQKTFNWAMPAIIHRYLQLPHHIVATLYLV